MTALPLSRLWCWPPRTSEGRVRRAGWGVGGALLGLLAAGAGYAQEAQAPGLGEPGAIVPMPATARAAGCTACHTVDRRMVRVLDEDQDEQRVVMPSVGPAWREVATRYRRVAGAEATLLRVVMQGSLPDRPHWQRPAADADRGPVMGLAMPPQRVILTEPEARTLVRWILALPDTAAEPPASTPR